MLYRTDDQTKWGIGKGANLTPTEVDGNFYELAERLIAVEASPGQAVNGIANITVTGSQMTVWLEDGTALGPYTLPTAMIRYRGDWTTSAAYNEMDLVADPDTGIYLVLQDHTSDAVAFDANAQDAEANPLYRFLFPIGAGAGASALADLSDVAEWLAPFNGDILRYDSGLGLWDVQSLTVHINDLDGVYNPEGATTGQVLAFNTTGTGWWEPTDLPTGGGGTSVSDEGTPVLAAPTDINFAGAGVAVTDDGDGTVTVTIGGGGGGGASALGDLSDVTIATPAAGQVIRYDGAGFANAEADWSDLANVPTTFTPEAHAHTTADISDFAEALDDRVAALLVAGTNVTLTYDDAAGSLTIDAAGGAGGGATTFLELTDTPAAYGTAGQMPVVNPTEDGLDFVDPPTGDVEEAPVDGALYARSDGAWAAITIPVPEGHYRYWRLRLTSEIQKAPGDNVWLFELEFRSTAGIQETATGGTVISSGWTNPSNAFGVSRANAASPFTDKYIGYDFDGPKAVEEVLVAYDTTFQSAPTNHVIEASNDNLEWVTAAEISLADVTADQVFTVSTAAPVDADSVVGVTPSAFVLGLLDDVDAAAARGTLGLGSVATQPASAVAITGGSIAGLAELSMAAGSDATVDLGIGTIRTVQPDVLEVTLERIGLRLKNILTTSGGWARSFFNYLDNTDASYLQFGGYGSGQTFTYGFIGPAYNDTWFRFYPDGGLVAGTPTGLSQGAGTINAVAVYDDGTLLCAPIVEAVRGSYDRADWQALAPHGGIDHHEAMKARGFRPASADSYADEIDGHEGIPGYWNRSEWEARRNRRAERQTDDITGESVEVVVEDRVSLAERHERALLALDYAALAIRDLTRRVQALEAEKARNA